MTLRGEYKELEQSYMVLRDQYSELAKAAGFSECGFWGDPIEHHEIILTRMKRMWDSYIYGKGQPD